MTMRAKGKAMMLAIAVCATALSAAPRPSAAHGDFDWINRGKYRSQSGELCCGVDDCYVVEPGRIHQGPEGYELLDHNIIVPPKQAIPSEDGKYWICKVGARMRCFFAPHRGW
jgi:hypothetical protein